MEFPKALRLYLNTGIWTFNHVKQDGKGFNLVQNLDFSKNVSQDDTFDFYHRLDLSEKNRNLKI